MIDKLIQCFRYTLVVAWCLVPSLAVSSPLVGQDYLASLSRNFNAKAPSKYLPDTTPLGVLDHTFSDDLSNLSRLVTELHPSYLRVHLLNTTCVRNKNCGSYEYVRGYTIPSLDAAIKGRSEKILKPFRGRIQVYKAFSQSFPSTKLLLSPALEHNLSPAAWRILADTVLSVWPEVQLVNSPEGKNNAERYRGAWIERHGDTPPGDADIVSLDGSDGTDIDSVRFFNRIYSQSPKIVFLWTRSYNCRNQGGWQDPRARTSCPSSSTFELMAHLADDRGAAPRFSGIQCRHLVPFKGPMIWKPLAEDKGDGDRRGNLPVAITPLGKGNVRVLGINGRDIGTLGRFGSYNGTANIRYYSGFSGGSNIGALGFERQAIKYSGSSWVFLKGEKSCAGPFIPGIRQGSFR